MAHKKKKNNDEWQTCFFSPIPLEKKNNENDSINDMDPKMVLTETTTRPAKIKPSYKNNKFAFGMWQWKDEYKWIGP